VTALNRAFSSKFANSRHKSFSKTGKHTLNAPQHKYYYFQEGRAVSGRMEFAHADSLR
jgi:hypothetical protein